MRSALKVTDFHFDLPPELIAQQPAAERGSSRMLCLDRRTGRWDDRLFRELPSSLRPGDLLVLNDSRVLPARLSAVRGGLRTQAGSPAPTGAVEVLLIAPVANAGRHNEWRALVRPAKKIQLGETLRFVEPVEPRGEAVALSAEVVATGCYGERTLRFAPVPDFHAALERIGSLPLPPYIRRDAAAPNTPEDRERYQTVYSRPFGREVQGSAAAPTAGLHFTEEMLERLGAAGVEIARLTLHVGLGTFQPVRVEDTRDIRLHAEPFTLGTEAAQAINRAHREGRRVVAVGTTTTRTLEHLAREFEREHGPAGPENPLQLEPQSGSTSLFLSPAPDGDAGFKLVRGLLTNFHLPGSTLLMLVSAFAGRERVLAAYAHAAAEQYRFFSYGDCMLLL